MFTPLLSKQSFFLPNLFVPTVSLAVPSGCSLKFHQDRSVDASVRGQQACVDHNRIGARVSVPNFNNCDLIYCHTSKAREGHCGNAACRTNEDKEGLCGNEACLEYSMAPCGPRAGQTAQLGA